MVYSFIMGDTAKGARTLFSKLFTVIPCALKDMNFHNIVIHRHISFKLDEISSKVEEAYL